MSSPVVLELSTVVDGRAWNLFTFEYDTPDGKSFAGYLHAISFEHAAAQLEDMKETAVLKGQMISGDV